MKKATITRQYIIERTAPVFNKKGFAGTSLADLTEATGLTKGAIYGNFANKDEVALMAFDFNFNQLRKHLEVEIRERESAIDKLLVYADLYGRKTGNPVLDGGCPLLNTAVEADDTHPGLKERVKQAFLLWQENLEKIIEYGQKRGEIKPEVQPHAVASLMIALLEGGVLLARTTGESFHLKNIVAHIRRLILTELKT